VDDPSRYGVIETDAHHRVLSFTEKPPRALARSRDINAGVYLFEREAFRFFPDSACSVERDIFPAMLEHDVHLHGYQAWPYWTDLGTPRDYLQAHLDILERKVVVPLSAKEVTPGCWQGAQLALAESALLRPPVILGDGVTIGAGAVIGPAVVLGDGVTVEADARVERSVLWDDVTIHRGSVVRGSILGRAAAVAGEVIEDICEDYAVRTNR